MKYFLLVVFLIVSIDISAQYYVGGSFGLGLNKVAGKETSCTYKIIPEFGYKLSNKWAVGLALGYKKGTCNIGDGDYIQNVNSKTFGIHPYVRYSLFYNNIFSIFTDGTFIYESNNIDGKNYNLGIRPGISFNICKKLEIVSHIGFIGIEVLDQKRREKSVNAGVDFDSSN